MAVLLDPNLKLEVSRHYVAIEGDSDLTRGMTVVDRLGVATDPRNSRNCEAAAGINFDLTIAGLWQQAAAEGTSVLVGSADGGASGCNGGASDSTPATNGIGVSAFASTPYNLAVGGTDFSDTVDGTNSTYWRVTNSPTLESAKSYIPEIPWNNSCASSVLYSYLGYSNGVAFCNSPLGSNWLEMVAGSGGPSAVHAKPSWQSGVLGIPGDGMRGIPDVSLFSSSGFYGHALVWCVSDPTPCVYSNPTGALFSAAGGTSFAAPMFAGIQALINQWAGSRQGNPAYTLYQLAAAEYGTNVSPNTANVAAAILLRVGETVARSMTSPGATTTWSAWLAPQTVMPRQAPLTACCPLRRE